MKLDRALRRIAVFASGAGSNFRNLLAAQARGDIGQWQIVCLVSDKPNCGAVAHAQAQGLPVWAHGQKAYGGKDAWESGVTAFLVSHHVDLLVLAGFMRLVGQTLLTAFEGRMINVHPSLLPAFPGLDAPAQALAAGVHETGVTVHKVDAGLDTGPIIAQMHVAIEPGDTLEMLVARLHRAEHELLPRVLRELL